MMSRTRKLLAGIVTAAALTAAMGMTAFAGERDTDYTNPYDPMLQNLEKTLEENDKQFQSAYDKIIADFEKEVENSKKETEQETKKARTDSYMGSGTGAASSNSYSGYTYTPRTTVPQETTRAAAVCRRCGGKGKVKCDDCDGMGKRTQTGSSINLGSGATRYEVKVSCRRCGGTGKVVCLGCLGDGES
ncbi:hypothetical protein C0033_03540 [Clostridium sp. chh4-2]|uniref:hypothetical protein n=1 Tax=Clostridium sp. chh4-2 TaxID=2067550 RepID=UPI000CCFA40D|nr:hypothetical protein [Clostridium sp. chh4-2]PNV63172.1 hypothetical protein C0033_03540 [Clostridium sp. chh4-2]